MAAKNFDQKFLGPFLRPCFFHRVTSWSENPQLPSLALGRQAGNRLSQGQCFFAVKAEALGNDRRPKCQHRSAID
jgi:hypothetical protein